MHFLIDTHVVIWSSEDPGRVPKVARNILEDEQNTIFVSIVSLWEISIKRNIGKLTQTDTVEEYFKTMNRLFGFLLLPINLKYLNTYETLPLANHRDPFDRLLVAQVITEGLTLVSADSAFDQYDVQRVWQ